MVAEIAYFEIQAHVSGWGRYGAYYDEPVAEDYGAKIAQAARAGKLPGTKPPKGPVSKFPERFLDIREDAKSHGVRAYAFHLNAIVDGRSRLEFGTGDPIMKFPISSSTHEDFLTEIRSWPEEPGRWASFVCDLDAVRASDLANRIREIAGAEKHPGPLFLRIPFWLNLIDPVLGASPWVVPAEDDEEIGEFRFPFLTHGGVHPAAAPALVVEI